MRPVKHRRVGQTAGQGGKGFMAGPRDLGGPGSQESTFDRDLRCVCGRVRCGPGGNVEHSLEHFFATIVKYERHREMCINIT